MLQFNHPDTLYLLSAIPVMAVLFVALHRWRKKLLKQFASSAMLGHLAPHMSTGKRSLKQLFLLSGLAFLIVALANPRVGTRLEEVKREGIDLFVALDVSLSMKAEDIRPNRLEKAKRDVSSLLRKLEGDRVGLIVFAGEAFIQFPLTSDYSAADLFISAVDVDVVPTPGTTIASAIEKALKSFPMDAPTQKAIIIVSDGENTEGNIMDAVEQANKAGVKIFTVGMGTPDGGPIPVLGPGGERIDYKRDQRGAIVMTKLDESTLQQIATITGGSYRRATSAGNEIDDIFEGLSSLEKIEFGVKQVTGYESVYQYPLALAILFLLLEVLLSERRGTVLLWLRRFFPVTASLAVLVISSDIASAQTHRDLIQEGNEAYAEERWPDAEAEYKKALQSYPGSPEAVFNLGNSYYRQARYDEAIQSFAGSVSKHPLRGSNALYNIGNSHYKADRFKESVEAYKQTLRLNPADDDARYNLQMAMEKLKNQQRQKQDQQQQQQQQQNEKDQQDQQKQEQDPQNQQQQDQREQQQQQQSRTAQQNQLPKEQAERILEALRNNEREIQKQLRKREGVRIKTEKDW